MSVRDGDPTGDEEMAERTRTGRGRMVAVAGGLALVLGGGYLVTAQFADRDRATVNRAPGALAPMVPVTRSAPATATGTGSPTPTASAASGTRTASATSGTRTASATSGTRTASAALGTRTASAASPRDRVPDGDAGRRPITAAGAGGISTSTRATAEGSIRVTSAKADLTGRSDLQMAADGGTPAGDGHCTQRLHVSDAGVQVVPTMLLCWRTSAKRSVITIAVATKGRPSAAASMAVLDREWARLG